MPYISLHFSSAISLFLSMMATFFCISITQLLMLFIFNPGFVFLQKAESLGINYGQIANNLPSPDQVPPLLRSMKITKTRIYDTNPQVLTAFANSGIDIIVTVPDKIVGTLVDPTQSLQWITTNIRPYFPATRITGISVGNEVYTGEDKVLMMNLVPAMASLHRALVETGLQSYIHVSTACSLAVLANSFPPSYGFFRNDLTSLMSQLLQFLSATNSPFWINAYPYFAYKDDPSRVPINYVLFNPNEGTTDPYTKLHYDNMLYAQVDSVIFAITRMGHGNLEVRVSETGWPSKGDPNEAGATMEFAETYNRNLIQRQMGNEGTPLRPSQRLEIYVFALFNEDMKPGPTSERNYGLYQPDGTMAYDIGFTTFSAATAATTSVSLASSGTKAKAKGFDWRYVLLIGLLTVQVLVRIS